MNQPNWRTKVLELYSEEQLSMAKVAERMNASGEPNMTKSHVDKILEIARVLPRVGKTPSPKATPPEPIPGIDAEYKAGTSLENLGRKYHRSHETIRAMLVTMGVTIRPAGKNTGDELRRLIK
jgi:hypothetical protein